MATNNETFDEHSGPSSRLFFLERNTRFSKKFSSRLCVHERRTWTEDYLLLISFRTYTLSSTNHLMRVFFFFLVTGCLSFELSSLFSFPECVFFCTRIRRTRRWNKKKSSRYREYNETYCVRAPSLYIISCSRRKRT